MRDLYAQEYGVRREDVKYLQQLTRRLCDQHPLTFDEMTDTSNNLYRIVETASNVSGLAAELHAIDQLCCKAEEAHTTINPEDIREIIMDPD